MTHTIRTFCAILVLLIAARNAAAQDNKAEQEQHTISREVFTHAEQMPDFPGGKAALSKYLSKNIKYPEEAYKHNIQGKVHVRFIVETDGSISDIRIQKGLSHGCDEETLRVLKKMPKWNPGMQNGAFVAVYYNLPVTFSLAYEPGE
jgi:protein TonB